MQALPQLPLHTTQETAGTRMTTGHAQCSSVLKPEQNLLNHFSAIFRIKWTWLKIRTKGVKFACNVSIPFFPLLGARCATGAARTGRERLFD